ncbi:hypothetical protein PR048_003387 [Dryococelus australis]|uniref:Uncharacterized protein n=1 Tax=Dryococelus australis TaxID=614101 RepID=A0ABQ9INE9_9NEOP|nr:hypothetical protein PR048_003387 [Dryococelus australis]
MEQRRNEAARGKRNIEKNPPISRIVRHDSFVRRSRSDLAGNRTHRLNQFSKEQVYSASLAQTSTEHYTDVPTSGLTTLLLGANAYSAATDWEHGERGIATCATHFWRRRGLSTLNSAACMGHFPFCRHPTRHPATLCSHAIFPCLYAWLAPTQLPRAVIGDLPRPALFLELCTRGCLLPFWESREYRQRWDLLASQTSSRLLEFPIRLATTQECSGETDWRLSPPRRIKRSSAPERMGQGEEITKGMQDWGGGVRVPGPTVRRISPHTETRVSTVHHNGKVENASGESIVIARQRLMPGCTIVVRNLDPRSIAIVDKWSERKEGENEVRGRMGGNGSDGKEEEAHFGSYTGRKEEKGGEESGRGIGKGEMERNGASFTGKKDWGGRNGKKSATAFIRDPSQHSPEARNRTRVLPNEIPVCYYCSTPLVNKERERKNGERKGYTERGRDIRKEEGNNGKRKVNTESGRNFTSWNLHQHSSSHDCQTCRHSSDVWDSKWKPTSCSTVLWGTIPEQATAELANILTCVPAATLFMCGRMKIRMRHDHIPTRNDSLIIVWVGMTHNYFIGLDILLRLLNKRTYSIFLQETLQELLANVHSTTRLTWTLLIPIAGLVEVALFLGHHNHPICHVWISSCGDTWRAAITIPPFTPSKISPTDSLLLERFGTYREFLNMHGHPTVCSLDKTKIRARSANKEELADMWWGSASYFEVGLLASHQGEPGSISGRFTPDFRKWESCRTMPLVGGFSPDLPFTPPFHSGTAPYSPHFTLISSHSRPR